MDSRVPAGPPRAASRTVCGTVPVKDGFCQVASRLPKPASATPEAPPVTARWMGGIVDQAARTTAGGPAAPPA
ncbi:hypothetical protein [Streptomyces odontomachi]|uniref:hypothetical protein n=1 Tax=Streptomyces odontomachi TaxID=2944940 RepID=UPI00210EB136|nr:hypothetical protein [Streptomyces sp. ODS25]